MKNKATKNTIYTQPFWLLCWSALFFSSSFNMIIPELPQYLRELGGAEYVGMIIGLFTTTAGLSRPFSGKLTDTIGRKPVMIFGAVVCVICGLMYPLVSSVFAFLALRMVHGFSTGFTPTAIAAYVADMVPSNRLGEAMGINGVFFGSGMAIGPAIGSAIKLNYSYDALFLTSTLFAVISILLVIKLKDTLEQRNPFKWGLLKIEKHEIVEPKVFSPALITGLSYASLGVLLTLIADWTVHLGIEYKGLFFIVYTIFSLLVRFVGGKTSDTYGRKPVAYAGLMMLFIGLTIMAWWQTLTGLMVGAAIYGMAIGVIWPAVSAWTIDLSDAHLRGRAIATNFIALEVGIGAGAYLSGWFYGEEISNIPIALQFCGGLALLGLLYLFFEKKLMKPKV